MPHYFITLQDSERETIAVDLPDDAQARVETIRFAGEVLRDQPEMLDHSGHLIVALSDAGERILLRIEVKEVTAT